MTHLKAIPVHGPACSARWASGLQSVAARKAPISRKHAWRLAADFRASSRFRREAQLEPARRDSIRVRTRRRSTRLASRNPAQPKLRTGFRDTTQARVVQSRYTDATGATNYTSISAQGAAPWLGAVARKKLGRPPSGIGRARPRDRFAGCVYGEAKPAARTIRYCSREPRSAAPL